MHFKYYQSKGKAGTRSCAHLILAVAAPLYCMVFVARNMCLRCVKYFFSQTQIEDLAAYDKYVDIFFKNAWKEMETLEKC